MYLSLIYHLIFLTHLLFTCCVSPHTDFSQPTPWGDPNDPTHLLYIPNSAFRYSIVNPMDFLRYGLLTRQYTPSYDGGMHRYVVLGKIKSKEEFVELCRDLKMTRADFWDRSLPAFTDMKYEKVNYELPPRVFYRAVESTEVDTAHGMTCYVLTLSNNKFFGFSNGIIIESWWSSM